jgi:hypothetical protein
MPTAGPMTPRDVAVARRVEVGSIYRYTATTRARLRAGLRLRPMDIPPPDANDDPPRWDPAGPIAGWLARTAPSTAGSPARKDTP